MASAIAGLVIAFTMRGQPIIYQVGVLLVATFVIAKIRDGMSRA